MPLLETNKVRPLSDKEIEAVMKELDSPELTKYEKRNSERTLDKTPGMNTICARIRTLYNMLDRNKNAEARKLLIGIMVYAKRMNSALRDRNGKYDEGWYKEQDENRGE